MSDRITHADLCGKVMIADETAQFINYGDALGISSFTSIGYPKTLPTALANRSKEPHTKDEEFVVDIYTGAFAAPDCDGVMAEADIIRYRMPHRGGSILRKSINSGKTKYQDTHLSHSMLYIEQGFLPIDAAIVKVTRITENGHLTPSSSIGNNVGWIDNANGIITEANSWQSKELEGVYDIYRIQHLPNRTSVPINIPGDRTDTPYIDVNPDKVVAVIETSASDRNFPFKPLDETSEAIAGHLLDFPEDEVRAGRLAYDQYIMQLGVGNVPDAVMAGLLDSRFENIRAYTEITQDGMIDLAGAGKMTIASATSFSLSLRAAGRMNNEIARYRENIILRPQQISNHPEVIRHVSLIAANGMAKADTCGNVNSTHINGSRMMNGIGGSGDFIRNVFVSSFISPSLAEDDTISAIVPLASYIDHIEHDTMVIITECGFADLRGLTPRDRTAKIVSVVYPEHQSLLKEYYGRVLKIAPGMSTPHDLCIAFDFHINMTEKGLMKG